jgi:8-oxo-dGTP diphosphatase
MSQNIEENDYSQITLAAGGVVQRMSENGIEILILKRERYGIEWCLPKGKLNKDESFTEAARREIHEESGCTVELMRFLGTDTYQTKDGIKCVFYWLCRLTGEYNSVPNEEVKEIIWLTPQQAIARLSHKNQRSLVQKTFIEENQLQGTLQKLTYVYGRHFCAKRWMRLESAITAFRNELGCILKTPAQNRGCVQSIYAALENASAALRAGNIDKGWKCFHSARRLMLLNIDGDDKATLQVKAIQIRHESSKLTNWRKSAINNLLPEDIEKEKLTPEILFDAALIVDEHHNNQAYKDSLHRTHVFTLGVLMTLTLVWLYCAIKDKYISFGGDATVESFSTAFVGLVTFGLFGALFSAILRSVDTNSSSSRIPEIALTIRVTLLRILLGAASAVIIYVILNSIFINMFTGQTLNISLATAYVFAFAGGTSERLVLRAVEKISKS